MHTQYCHTFARGDLVYRLAEAKLSAVLTFARLPPPGLAEFSQLNRMNDTNVSQHVRVVDVYESHKGGGLTLMETETADDVRSRALLAMAIDPFGESEAVQWVRLDGGEGRSGRWFEVLASAELPLEESQVALETGLDTAEALYAFRSRLSLTMVAWITSQMSAEPGQGFPLCILADSLSFGPVTASLDFLTAVQILPGCCLLALSTEVAFTIRRRTPRACLHSFLPSLDNLTSNLLTDFALVSRVPSLHQRHSDNLDSLLHALRELTGHPLPGLTQWARLLTRQAMTEQDLSATATAFFAPQRMEHTLDELWTYLLGRNVLASPSANQTETPMARALLSESLGERTACRLIVLVPALHALCDTRQNHTSSSRVDTAAEESDRMAALKRTFVRVQYPYSSQPLFAVEAGLPANEPSFGRLPVERCSVTPEETRREADVQTEVTHTNGKRRLTNGPQDYRLAKQTKYNKERHPTQLPSDHPLDLRLRLRFSKADLQLGQTTLKAFDNVIDTYLNFLQSLPPDLKAKTYDDVTKMVYPPPTPSPIHTLSHTVRHLVIPFRLH